MHSGISLKVNGAGAGDFKMNQSGNNLLQFAICYTGFEKAVWREMDVVITNNKRVFQRFLSLPHFCSVPANGGKINIHVVCLNGNGDLNWENLQTNSCPMLCVRDFDSLEQAIECIRAGSSGCVSYRNLFKEIVPAIISVLQDKIYVSPSFFPVVYNDLKVDGVKSQATQQLFTQREKNLVQLLTTGALYKEIASTLQISENTVRSHIRHIYSKLKVHSKTELAIKIIGSKIVSSLSYFIADYTRSSFDIACLCY